MMYKSLNRAILVLGFLLVTISILGQEIDDDMELIGTNIKETPGHDHVDHDHQQLPSFLLADHPSLLVRYNPVTLVFGGLLWGYQALVSPQLASTCLYSPSCSAFSKNLLQEYGILRGLIFTADRISRCNRLALYDYPPWEIDHQIHKVHEQVEYYKIKK